MVKNADEPDDANRDLGRAVEQQMESGHGLVAHKASISISTVVKEVNADEVEQQVLKL